MWRSRRWCGVGSVAVAVVGAAALSWPAVAAVGLAAVSGAQADTGTLLVSPSGMVTASVATILTFTFTAPAPLPPTTSPTPAIFVAPLPTITVTLSMAQGWTASSPSDLTCTPSACTTAAATGTATGTQFTVVLYRGANSFTLEVQATPPGSAGPASFTATEVIQGKPPTTLATVTSSPFNVICPAGGLGAITVDPTTVAVASSGIFTFTYTAGSCGEGVGGMVGVTAPDGWTPTGQVVASAGNLAPGTPVTITYGPAQAGSTGPATFVAWQAAAGGPAQTLASAPVVTVTQPQVTSSSSSSLSTSPSSTQASSTQASSTQASSTQASSTQASSTQSPSSRTVIVTPSRVTPSHVLPVALVASGLSATGLILLAGTAGLLASRSRRRRGRPRRGGHGTGGGNVRAVPHAGPSPSVAVRDTGNRPTLTVRLEPQAYATMTTIKENRP
jgi:hypothetical protein